MRLTGRTKGGEAYLYNMAGIEKAIDKLATYEDAEEQGRLVILPCAVEDAVYYINPDAIGKTVFFTHEEAEAAMKGEKTCDR